MPAFGDPAYYYGDPAGFIAWDGTHIVRCANILSPTWEIITGSIDGTIYDCQLVIDAQGKAVLWLLTSTAVWVCRDGKAASVVWQEVLTIEAVQAADATPVAPEVAEFKCFATCQAADGYCIVATGPTGGDGANTTYAHAYFRHTHDHGGSWTSVDVGSFTGTGEDYSFVYADRRAMQTFPALVSGEIVVWCVRSTPVDVLNTDAKIFKSSDGGHSWSLGSADVASGFDLRRSYALLAPQFDLTDPAYVVSGGSGVSDRPDIRRSTNDWGSITVLTSNGDPTGYGGINNLAKFYRVGRRFDDGDHVLAWFRHTATTFNHLLQSENQGDDFTLLYNQGSAQAYATPINWPPDPDVWVWVISRDSNLNLVANAVMRTVNNFANVADASGNLEALIGTWTAGFGGGLYLPKERLGLDASLTVFLRVQAARQDDFGEAAAPTFGLPVSFEYSDGDLDQLAKWDSGAWTPITIVERIAQFATFKLRGALFFELMPLLLGAGFAPMEPNGDGPYAYEDAIAPGATGTPAGYTFRFGGNDGNRSPTSMVQVQDAYLSKLTLSFDLSVLAIKCESEWFGRFIDDNDGSGYEPEAVALPDGLSIVNGLLATLGLQDAGDSGGAFDAISELDGDLTEWTLTIDTGLRPAWSGDGNGLTYCGLRQEWPSVSFVPVIRTNIDSYALVMAKAQARQHQELQLTFYGDDRSLVLRMTGRWQGKLNGHERARGEVVMKPTFDAATPAAQTTTPHWLSYEVLSGWEH